MNSSFPLISHYIWITTRFTVRHCSYRLIIHVKLQKQIQHWAHILYYPPRPRDFFHHYSSEHLHVSASYRCTYIIAYMLCTLYRIYIRTRYICNCAYVINTKGITHTTQADCCVFNLISIFKPEPDLPILLAFPLKLVFFHFILKLNALYWSKALITILMTQFSFSTIHITT